MARSKNTRNRRRATPPWKRRVRGFFGIVTLLTLLTVLLGLLFLGGIFFSVAKDLPAPEDLMNYTPGGITEIYATDKDKKGKHIVLGRVFSENRKFVPISKIPQVLKDATVAIEDERFYSHPGVDLRGMARALWVNVRGGRLLEGQGGSTLTQQLARNVYLNRRKTVSRKAQEIMLAIQIEKNYSKEQILEFYLNQVYYGAGAYGVQAASEVYFGRPVQALSVSQAALIAGLAQLPSHYDPFENKKAAITRRNTVLAKMGELGYIKPEVARVAQRNGVFLAPRRTKDQEDFKAPYFVNYVVRQLVERYGSDTVYRGGLKVYTTLNWAMQQKAEQVLVNGVRYASRQRVTEGALVTLEPRTGYIRAMVGGADYKRNQYNNVTQGRRQPGSAFKVFVYSAALDTRPDRYGMYSSVDNSRRSYGRGRNAYRPSGGGPSGPVSLRTALTYSYNNAAVNTAYAIGPSTVIEYARRMGIESNLQPNLSLALGSYEVTPLELTGAYCTFANGGDRVYPMGIIRVVDPEGSALEDNAPQVQRQVIRQDTWRDMNAILQNVVTEGTASNASGIHEIPHAHGKTGTTNENKDAWFVGYTPELCTAVWVCGAQFARRGDRAVVTRYVPMAASVMGGRICAPMWARYMQAAIPIQRKSGTSAVPVEKKPAPPAVDVAVSEQRARRERSAYARTAEDPEYRPRSERRRARRQEVIAVRAEGGDDDGAETVAASVTPAPEVPEAPPAPAPAVFAAPRAPRVTAPAPPPVVYVPEPRAPAPPPPPREVSVSVCSDSGQRATRWCPETFARQVPAARAPRGRCRMHRPRPGDG